MSYGERGMKQLKMRCGGWRGFRTWRSVLNKYMLNYRAQPL